VAREIVPGAERKIKFAGLIATADTAIDVLYGWTQFVAQFGDRLYVDLEGMGFDTSPFVPAIIQALSFNGKDRLVPEHSEMEIFIYNKQYFQDAGLDPEKKDWTWEELYAAAPKLTKGNRYPCAQAWGNGAYYWLMFYNSIQGAQLLSDDKTALLFDNDNGLLAFKTVDQGFKAGFFDPAFYSGADDYATGRVFNGGGAASQINFSELWGQAVSKNVKDFGATIDPSVVGATVVPGITAGTSGTINGFEGFGISQFSQHKDAAYAMLQILGSKDFQLKMHTFNLPSSRTDVLTDPENLKVFAVGDVLSRQGTFNLNRYPAPYDWTPPFNDAITKMIKGDFTPAQAHASAVKGVQDIIVKYLSS
jgi:multiple sugar transport system substrate-binding protein